MGDGKRTFSRIWEARDSILQNKRVILILQMTRLKQILKKMYV